jgi:hypothetical protein
LNRPRTSRGELSEPEDWLRSSPDAFTSVILGMDESKNGELGTFPTFVSCLLDESSQKRDRFHQVTIDR